MKERYPVTKHTLSTTFLQQTYSINHIPPKKIRMHTSNPSNTHRISCGWFLDVSACTHACLPACLVVGRRSSLIYSVAMVTDCPMTCVADTMKRLCHGRRRCTVFSDERTLGKPCVSRGHKYLAILHTCRKLSGLPSSLCLLVFQYLGRRLWCGPCGILH